MALDLGWHDVSSVQATESMVLTTVCPWQAIQGLQDGFKAVTLMVLSITMAKDQGK